MPTHALSPASLAVDNGDPYRFVGQLDIALHDQRGAPFTRIFGDIIDIGAFELQPTPLTADFNSNGRIDGRDFLAWQRGFGAGNVAAAFTKGNADLDNDVDSADLAVWSAQFGAPQSESAGLTTLAPANTRFTPTPLSPQAVDAAMAFQQADTARLTRSRFRPRVPRAH
jgi:hypothetical protein